MTTSIKNQPIVLSKKHTYSLSVLSTHTTHVCLLCNEKEITLPWSEVITTDVLKHIKPEQSFRLGIVYRDQI